MERKYIQLLQYTEYDPVTITQCKIKVDRKIRHCGMHSHISQVKNGDSAYIHHISREACLDLHKFGQIKFGNSILDKLIVNATNRRSITLAGKVNTDGTCSGTYYVTDDYEYDNVIVTAKLEIILQSYEATANKQTNEVILRSGTRCKFTDSKCIDFDENYNFWNFEPQSQCNFDHYIRLYEGYAAKVSDNPRSIFFK